MIGVIDSGAGGANVIIQCSKLFNEKFVFLVDNKNCPYGNKNKNELLKILKENIKTLIDNFAIDLIIIACNTLSSLIDYQFLEEYKIPILKTQPNVENLVNQSHNKILFATKNTIKNSKIVSYYKKSYNNFKCVHISNLAYIIDDEIAKNNIKNSKNIKKMLKKLQKIDFLLKNNANQTIHISLGCTHFRYIQKQISQGFLANTKFLYCEDNVAKIAKFFIKTNYTQSTYKIILTKVNNSLEKNIYSILTNNYTQ